MTPLRPLRPSPFLLNTMKLSSAFSTLGLALLLGWSVGAGIVFGLALSVASTVVLLRALQESEIDPIGAKRSVKVDVRIVSATNRDLAQAVRDYGYARGAFPRVMLARMPAGGVIHPHIDANPAAKWPHKVHVPLTTNPGVVSFFGGAEHHFPVGEAVEVDNLGPHWVRNEGDADRIHLIFEYYDPDQPDPEWLAPLLSASR